MVDFLKLKLSSSKTVKKFIANIAEKKIYEKFGYKVSLDLNDIQVDAVDGEVKVHINADAKMAKEDVAKITSRIMKL